MTRGGWVIGILLLVGCATPTPSQSPLPTRPPVPEGWVEITMGSVRVAVPEVWGPDIGGVPGSILISALLPPGNNDGVGVIAVGPGGEVHPDPPLTDERLSIWLLDWVTNARPDRFSRSIVLLPAGRAVCIRATYQSSTPDSTDVAACAIPRVAGVAVIEVTIDSDLMGRYGGAMELIPMLFDFGFAASEERSEP